MVWYQSLPVIYSGMLFFGTGTVLFSNLQLRCSAVGSDGKTRDFQFPWFQNHEMFISMGFSLAIYFLLRLFVKKQSKGSMDSPSIQEKLVEKSQQESAPSSSVHNRATFKQYLTVLIPAAFDLFGSGLMTVGLLKTSPSIMQMMRGSMIVFSAVLSVIFLKKKLKNHHYLGIFFAVVAISMVGVSSVRSGMNVGKSGLSIAIGCLLVVASQFVQACQIVTEEFLMKGIELHPLVIVGMEGVWGELIQLAIASPILYFIPGDDAGGSYENHYNALVMMGNSSVISGFIAGFMLLVLWYNVFGMMVTFSQSAIHRTILEAMRTGCIWLLDLFIYYVIDKPDFGEQWDNWSFLQLGGFLLLIFSMFLYENNVPWVDKMLQPPSPTDYQQLEADTTTEADNVIATATPVGKRKRMAPPKIIARSQ